MGVRPKLSDLPWPSDIRRATRKTAALVTTLRLCGIWVTNFSTYCRRCLKRLRPLETINRHVGNHSRRRMPGFARWRLSYRTSWGTSLFESGRMPRDHDARYGRCQGDSPGIDNLRNAFRLVGCHPRDADRAKQERARTFWRSGPSASPLSHLMRLRDVPIRQPCAYPRPCEFELRFAVLQIGARSAIAVERWLAANIAAPRPLIDMSRKAGIFPDPANRQAAPYHSVVVEVAFPDDLGEVNGDGFVVEHRPALFAKRDFTHIARNVTVIANLSDLRCEGKFFGLAVAANLEFRINHK